MEHNDPEKLARELERQAHELEQRSEAVGKEISDARQKWREREDSVAPGAAPPDDDERPQDAEPAA
jgi:hypothetical protein